MKEEEEEEEDDDEEENCLKCMCENKIAYQLCSNITKTCPCNKKGFFLALKIENFQLKFLIFFLCLLKT